MSLTSLDLPVYLQITQDGVLVNYHYNQLGRWSGSTKYEGCGDELEQLINVLTLFMMDRVLINVARWAFESKGSSCGGRKPH